MKIHNRASSGLVIAVYFFRVRYDVGEIFEEVESDFIIF